MELKINVYKGGMVEKTYTANDYEVMYGTVEDLLDVLDLEALTDKADKDSLISAVSRLLNSRKDIINPLMMDIFEGLTEEELRRVKAREIIAVIVGLSGFSLEQLKSLYFRHKK